MTVLLFELNIERKYFVTTEVTDTITAAKILSKEYFTYNFGDGWIGKVTVKDVTNDKTIPIKKGAKSFSDYIWMIASIIKYGEILNILQQINRDETAAHLKIRTFYKKKTDTNHLYDGGDFSNRYVEWLENKLITKGIL